MRINRYLGRGYRSTAAHVLQQAFNEKLKGILGTEEEVHQVILASLDAKHIIVARSSEGELIGVAAYQHNGQCTLNISLSIMIKVYGLIRGLYKMLQLIMYFPSKRDKDVVYVDAIAVDENFRGLGVGKMLLEEVEKLALEHHARYVSLDVIKENPRAKKLYEQIGFVEVKYNELDERTSDKLGFSGYYYMMKIIG
ncbi:GNAT family N-acetyltransferase [Myroides odoratimimus]|uniref:GNAT family N-acetyltransferase n=1 Tax=Myroides odoratimimus TaxID=76832 RepID=UPI00257812F4|nr:GNAT family N-acetyltransferase [Myroides odoratimimus]